MLAQLPGVPGEVPVAVLVVAGGRRVEERVQGHLGVDHDVLAAGQVHDQVRSQGAAVAGRRDLLVEVAARDQTGELHRPAQVQLPPAPAHLRPAQRGRERGRLPAQRLGGVPHLLDVLAQLALPRDPVLLEVAQLVVQPVEALLDHGVVAGPRLERKSLGRGVPGVGPSARPQQRQQPTEQRADGERDEQRERRTEVHASQHARPHRHNRAGAADYEACAPAGSRSGARRRYCDRMWDRLVPSALASCPLCEPAK